jgi:hypothetical protein
MRCLHRGRRARLAPAQLADLEDDSELRARLDVPTLDDLRWRLDVIISSSSVQVVLRPQLTLQCTLSDGSVHAFHVSKQQFNELRYTVARCLKEMDDGPLVGSNVATAPATRPACADAFGTCCVCRAVETRLR